MPENSNLNRAARIAPAFPPFPDEIDAILRRTMPDGVPPLTLFTTLARDPRLFAKFMKGGLLDKGHLSLRQREIVIDRVTAQNGSEYEWGVHAAFFAERVGLDEAQLFSLVHGKADDPCWTVEEERCLIAFCDELHETASLTEQSWSRLRQHFSEEALIELLMLAGFYRTVSYLTNALALPLEDFAARFPVLDGAPGSA